MCAMCKYNNSMKRLNNKNKYNHHNRDSELFDAVFLGDIYKVRYLIDIGADVNSIDKRL